MDKHINSFGGFLAEHRKELGMTGEQMAKRLRISHSYYNAFETGKRNAPEQEMVDQLADVLCLEADDRPILYDLAAKTHDTVAADLQEYINENQYLRRALRRARDLNASMEEWIRFIAQVQTKPRDHESRL